MTVKKQETNIWDEAMIPEPKAFFGLVDIEFVQGVMSQENGSWGYAAYNPAIHGTEKEVAAADGQFMANSFEFTITPIQSTFKISTTKVPYRNRRKPAFAKVVIPSINALLEQIAKIKGLKVGDFSGLREINEMYVGGEYVPEPRNEEYNTIKFTQVFATKAGCAAAAGVEVEDDLPWVDDPAPAAVPPAPAIPTPPVDPQRAGLAAFLPAMWTAAGQNKDKFYSAIATNPMLSNLFNSKSPEVCALTGEAPF